LILYCAAHKPITTVEPTTFNGRNSCHFIQVSVSSKKSQRIASIYCHRL